MTFNVNFGWTATIGEAVLGATKADGGTRRLSYRIGGGTTLPFLETHDSPAPLIAPGAFGQQLFEKVHSSVLPMNPGPVPTTTLSRN